ncbi:MAG: DUF1080 domain-containing protein [Pseudomonadota bacterium]|nr:hypothetical protein [Gammaproteobacteria bacterium]MEE2683518.1 DUF1080 domain-containing protein [Pseudomonadota bacterium]
MKFLIYCTIYFIAFISSSCIQNNRITAINTSNELKQNMLLNGISDHWNEIGDVNWSFQDETVSSTSGTGHLISKESYDNFILEADFWINDVGNSGIFIRCSNYEEIAAATCYEINIFDQRPDQRFRTGAIVNYAEPKVYISAGGNWNRFKIIADGPSIIVYLNGHLVVDIVNSKLRSGPITLQNNGGAIVKFKNVLLEEL